MTISFRYGQVQASEYLSQPNASITGLVLEDATGRLCLVILLMFALALTTTIIRDRVPTSKEQLFAMKPVDWGVLGCAFSLWSFSLSDMLLRTALIGHPTSLAGLCRATSTTFIMAVTGLLVPFFVVLMEVSRSVAYPHVPRCKSKEHLALVTAHFLASCYVGPSLYRVSGVAKNNLCVIGLPRDTFGPLLGIAIVFGAFFCYRICVPLLRIDHARMKAWGLRTAVGIIFSAMLSISSFTFLVMSSGYLYHTYCILIFLSNMLAVVGSAAYLITWRPQYKQVLPLPEADQSSIYDEATRHAELGSNEKILCFNCNCLEEESRQTVSKWSEDARTVVTMPVKARTHSILDSKSVAEFLLDEDSQTTLENLQSWSGPHGSQTDMTDSVPSTIPCSALRAPRRALSSFRTSKAIQQSADTGITTGTTETDSSERPPRVLYRLADWPLRPRETSSCLNKPLPDCPPFEATDSPSQDNSRTGSASRLRRCASTLEQLLPSDLAAPVVRDSARCRLVSFAKS